VSMTTTVSSEEVAVQWRRVSVDVIGSDGGEPRKSEHFAGVAWAARIMRAGKTVADRLLWALFFLRWLRPRRKHEADLGGSLAFFGFACHFT